MAMDEVVDDGMHEEPEGDVEQEDGGDVAGHHVGGHDVVERYEEEADEENEDHHDGGTHASAQQFVVEMVLVGQEGVVAVAQTEEDDTDDVEQGDEQRRDGHDQLPRVVVAGGHGDAQAQHEVGQDEAQHEAAAVAHEELMALAGVAEDIKEPEGHEDTQGGGGQCGMDVVVEEEKHGAKDDEADAGQSGGQSVDAVDEVEGVDGVDHEDYGERNTDPR